MVDLRRFISVYWQLHIVLIHTVNIIIMCASIFNRFLKHRFNEQQKLFTTKQQLYLKRVM